MLDASFSHNDTLLDDTFFTVAEVAARLQMSRADVHRIIWAGDLEAVGGGRTLRVGEKALQSYQRYLMVCRIARPTESNVPGGPAGY